MSYYMLPAPTGCSIVLELRIKNPTKCFLAMYFFYLYETVLLEFNTYWDVIGSGSNNLFAKP